MAAWRKQGIKETIFHKTNLFSTKDTWLLNKLQLGTLLSWFSHVKKLPLLCTPQEYAKISHREVCFSPCSHYFLQKENVLHSPLLQTEVKCPKTTYPIMG